MLKCSYIIFLYNNEATVNHLVTSLQKIQGNFRKEFIFIEDGSTDKTLQVLKNAITSLPHSTIIVNEHQGTSVSLNKAMSLASGDYIQFVEGTEIMKSDTTISLMAACVEHGNEVAMGKVAHDKPILEKIKENYQNIENPILIILDNSLPEAHKIGRSGSIVTRSVLEKVSGCDGEIYTHNMSLSLRLSKYSSFSFIDELITYNPTLSKVDLKFESYNNIKSIYNFLRNHKKNCKAKADQLIKALSIYTYDNTAKFKYKFAGVTAKYLKSHNIDKVLEMYKKEIDRLF